MRFSRESQNQHSCIQAVTWKLIMCDGKHVRLVEVRVDFSRREIVTESEIRINKETQLCGQLIEGLMCIF